MIYGNSHLCAMEQVVQQNYSSPMAPVYITEGNGGVPGAPGTHTFKCGKSNGAPSDCPTDWMRTYATGGAYGRLRASNGTVLTYEHVFNNGNDGKGEVMESWSITDATHVFPPHAFPPPAPPAPPPAPPITPKPNPPPGKKWICQTDVAFGPVKPLVLKVRGTCPLCYGVRVW